MTSFIGNLCHQTSFHYFSCPLKSSAFLRKKIFQSQRKFHFESLRSAKKDPHHKTRNKEKKITKKENKKEERNFSGLQNENYLTKVCDHCFSDNRIDKENLELRHQVTKDVKRLIKGSKVFMFGSSANGFGECSADLDLAIFFDDVSKSRVGRKIGFMIKGVLARSGLFEDVYFVHRAKVPVVTFRHIKTNFVGDLSFSNYMALYNTVLLKRYSELDERVQPIVYAVKKLMKERKTLGTRSGFVSSYAYTLMVIYFLQQVQPPVLPSLQEVDDLPEKLIERNNVAFLNDLTTLQDSWNRENCMSTGTLFVSFMDFYAYDFDYKNCSVCIKTTRKVKRSEFFEDGSRMMIVDPFERKRNLARMLDSRTFKLMVEEFRSASKRLRTSPPFNVSPDDAQQLQKYYFNTERSFT